MYWTCHLHCRVCGGKGLSLAHDMRKRLLFIVVIPSDLSYIQSSGMVSYLCKPGQGVLEPQAERPRGVHNLVQRARVA